MHCMLCMSTQSIQRIKACNAFNTMYIDTVDAKYIHIFLPHNFLNIQLIFNPKRFLKAETKGFPTIPLNAMYVDTVDLHCKYFYCI